MAFPRLKQSGKKKFIDAFDWCNATDVTKFKTDVIHIVVCVHCHNDFGDVEQNYGLCPTVKSYTI